MSQIAPPLQRAAQRHLIGVLEMPTHGQTVRQAREAHATGFHELRQVQDGGIAFHVGVSSADDLTYATPGDAFEQGVDLELFRTNTIQR